MKSKVSLIIALLSTVALIIELVLFYNMGIYVDEYSTSPDIVYGGDFWLKMAWLKMFLLFGITASSWIKTFHKNLSAK